MKEIIAEWKKATENKIVWSVNIASVPFNIYIPKWRTPQPVPEKILIKIFDSTEKVKNKEFVLEADIQFEPELKRKKIYADIHKFSDHTKTLRFDPEGDPNNWEIGSIYIPKSILRNRDVHDLSLVIEWVSQDYLVKSEEISVNKTDDKKIKIATNNLISEFELKIRKFIKNQLEQSYGEDWWNQGIPQNIREIAEKRKSNKEKIEPKRTYNIIDFLNFWDYNNIMLYKKNWNNIFKEFFREKYVIQSPFEKLLNIRNDIAHNRFIEEDFERCKTYIEDILKYLPDL